MLIISQERDESGLDHSDIGRGGGVKCFWIYLEGKISRVWWHIVKLARKRITKDDTKIFSLGNWKHGVAINWDGKREKQTLRGGKERKSQDSNQCLWIPKLVLLITTSQYTSFNLLDICNVEKAMVYIFCFTKSFQEAYNDESNNKANT